MVPRILRWVKKIQEKSTKGSFERLFGGRERPVEAVSLHMDKKKHIMYLYSPL
jgi:hypothetical protein